MSAVAAPDWRRRIPPERRRRLRAWFAAGAGLTFLIVVVGGITRLTQSGLSIVDWQPIVGVVPPMGEAEWREAFARYQQFPEYQTLRPDMTLAEFRFIFFWEYTHRLLARLIGIVFLVPFCVFAARGWFRGPLLGRVLLLFGLGALQGFVGWFMVRSGLVDDPRVSHFRLALHLSVALCIFALCVWLWREMRDERAPSAAGADRTARVGVAVVGVLLAAQILYGAFVAGLDAGLGFNTFPRMGGRFFPPGGLAMDPALWNFLANPWTVQWVHRVLGTVLLAAAAAAYLRLRRPGADARSRRFAGALAVLVAAQYALGVATLVLSVPVSLGVLHQGFAVVVFGVWVLWLHHALRAPRPRPVVVSIERVSESPVAAAGYSVAEHSSGSREV